MSQIGRFDVGMREQFTHYKLIIKSTFLFFRFILPTVIKVITTSACP